MKLMKSQLVLTSHSKRYTMPTQFIILHMQLKKSVWSCLLHAGTCLAAVERAMADTDVSSVLPLGRQHGLLNIIDVVLHKLGHLIQAYLPKLLQILLCVTASVGLLLDRREQVSCHQSFGELF